MAEKYYAVGMYKILIIESSSCDVVFTSYNSQKASRRLDCMERENLEIGSDYFTY
jgi:hypothetical protein